MSKIVPAGARTEGVSHLYVFPIPIFQQSINRLSRIAARTFGVSAGCVASVNRQNQIRIQACYGIDSLTDFLPGNPLLAAALEHELFVIEDVRQVPELAAYPVIIGHVPVRFWASIPIKDPNDQIFGLLFVFDQHARMFTSQRNAMLIDLAETIEDEVQMLLKTTDTTRAMVKPPYGDSGFIQGYLDAEQDLDLGRPVGLSIGGDSLLEAPIEVVATNFEDLLSQMKDFINLMEARIDLLGGAAVLGPGSNKVEDDDPALTDRDDSITSHDLSSLRFEVTELLDLKNEAESLSKLKGAFLSYLSHEIRTPLTSVIGFADILLDQVDEENREFAGLIRNSGNQIMNTLNTLHTFMKLENRALVLKPERIDVVRLIRTTLTRLRPKIKAGGLSLSFLAPQAAIFEVDRNLLSRFIVGIVRFSTKVLYEGCITIEFHDLHDAFTLRVYNSSLDDPGRHHSRLAEAVEEASKEELLSYQGHRFEIVIAEWILELMGGTMQIEESEHGGKAVFVRIVSTKGATLS